MRCMLVTAKLSTVKHQIDVITGSSYNSFSCKRQFISKGAGSRQASKQVRRQARKQEQARAGKSQQE